MQKRKTLRVEELERRDVPSCAGLQNALTNPGAEHRSDASTEQLQDNMAVQCPSDGVPSAKTGLSEIVITKTTDAKATGGPGFLSFSWGVGSWTSAVTTAALPFVKIDFAGTAVQGGQSPDAKAGASLGEIVITKPTDAKTGVFLEMIGAGTSGTSPLTTLALKQQKQDG
jgi:hypothetical protein